MSKPSITLTQLAFDRRLRKAAVVERERVIALLNALARGYYITAQGERYRAMKEAIETIERNS